MKDMCLDMCADMRSVWACDGCVHVYSGMDMCVDTCTCITVGLDDAQSHLPSHV